MARTLTRTCLVCGMPFKTVVKGRPKKHAVCPACKETETLCKCGWPLSLDEEEDYDSKPRKTCQRCREKRKGYNATRARARRGRAYKQKNTGGDYVNAAPPADSLPRSHLTGIPTGKTRGGKMWVRLD